MPLSENRQRAKLARKVLRSLEKGKAFYQAADAAMHELLALGVQPGSKIRVGRGKDVEVVDNFAEKNKVFRAHGIARIELKPVERV